MTERRTAYATLGVLLFVFVLVLSSLVLNRYTVMYTAYTQDGKYELRACAYLYGNPSEDELEDIAWEDCLDRPNVVPDSIAVNKAFKNSLKYIE